MRGALRWAAAVAAGLAVPAVAGPVEVTLEGPRFCPRDRAAGARVLNQDEAMARARSLLPDGYCGPAPDVDGCDVDVEVVADTFRVYAHQYKLRAGRHDWMRLQHSYLILDPVGNCLAHIPGTGAVTRD